MKKEISTFTPYKGMTVFHQHVFTTKSGTYIFFDSYKLSKSARAIVQEVAVEDLSVDTFSCQDKNCFQFLPSSSLTRRNGNTYVVVRSKKQLKLGVVNLE